MITKIMMKKVYLRDPHWGPLRVVKEINMEITSKGSVFPLCKKKKGNYCTRPPERILCVLRA